MEVDAWVPTLLVAAAAAALVLWFFSPPLASGEDVVLEHDDARFGSLVRIGGDRLKEAAALAATAYAYSPSYLYIHGDLTLEDRVSALTYLFERSLHLGAVAGTTRMYGVVEKGDARLSSRRLVAFVLFRPVGAKAGLLRMVRYGVLGVVLKGGVASLPRLLEAAGVADSQLARGADGSPSAHALERMVVLPSRQGRGVGTWLLRGALKAEGEVRGESRTVLCTQEERNVSFYRKSGFHVVLEEVAYGVQHWVMAR